MESVPIVYNLMTRHQVFKQVPNGMSVIGDELVKIFVYISTTVKC